MQFLCDRISFRIFSCDGFLLQPNIYPEAEYDKRVAEQQRFIKEFPTKYPVDFISGTFDKERFYQTVKGYEQIKEGGERCFRCYELRLSETAKLAKQLGVVIFTTTLSNQSA